jgi:hypothetical protein
LRPCRTLQSLFMSKRSHFFVILTDIVPSVPLEMRLDSCNHLLISWLRSLERLFQSCLYAPLVPTEGKSKCAGVYMSYKPINCYSILCVSVHSGETNELVPQQWPAFDRTGFEVVQRSMVNFGQHVFSKCDRLIHDCRSNSLQRPCRTECPVIDWPSPICSCSRTHSPICAS